MSENCTHDCSSCGKDCAKRDLHEPFNQYSKVKKVYAVVSGKGGVGKSTVTALLALAEAKKGKTVGIMDADITGPSIPKIFGVKERAMTDGDSIYPVVTKTGIKTISMNLLLENDTEPVVWRGPVIAGVLKQFWTDVNWGDLDTLFIDCPPGTGDVPLTVFQTFRLDGIIVVTTPQDLVEMIVEKAVKMAGLMHIPVTAFVENLSFYECPDCKTRHEIFGESKVAALAARYGVEKTARLPISEKLRRAEDEGTFEFYGGEEIGLLGALTE